MAQRGAKRARKEGRERARVTEWEGRWKVTDRKEGERGGEEGEQMTRRVVERKGEIVLGWREGGRRQSEVEVDGWGRL